MRTTTSTELTNLAADDRQDGLRVKIADAGDTLQDYSSWARDVSISVNVNSRAATASVTLHREVSGTSLAPLVETSIAAGRRITIEAAVVGADDTVSAGDWQLMFRGVVDRANWGGTESRVTLECRDLWGRLKDRWIESVATYGSSGGTAMETVIQSLLDDTLGGGQVSLVTPSSPSYSIFLYEQDRASLGDAIAQVADLNGWDLRYRYNESASDFRLTLSEPDRNKSTADHTFSDDDYESLSEIGEETTGVRNVAEVQWDASNSEVAVDSASVAEFRRRFIFFDSTDDPQINTSGRANTLATAVVGDLGQPIVQQVATGPFFWPVELGDLYTWEANGVHYDTDQDLAVTGYEHRWDKSGAKTTFYCRGKPSGSASRWYQRHYNTDDRKRTGSQPRQPVGNTVTNLVATVASDGVLSAFTAGGSRINSWRVFGRSGSAPTDAQVEGASVINGSSLTETDVGTLDTLSNGETGYVAAIPYPLADGGGVPGERLDATVRYGITDAGEIADGVIIADKLTENAAGFSTDISFSATDYNTVSWSSGTLEFANGNSYSIGSGNTGNMSALTYIYFDKSASTTALQTTTTYSDVVADDKRLLCVAKQASATGSGAFFVPAVGTLGINVDNIAANSITTNMIQSNQVTAAKISVVSLSAISADVGTLTAGLIENSTGARFIDLDASGTEPFIKHDNFELLADGTATFSGEVAANSFTGTSAEFDDDLTVGGSFFAGFVTLAKSGNSGELGTVELYGETFPNDYGLAAVYYQGDSSSKSIVWIKHYLGADNSGATPQTVIESQVIVQPHSSGGITKKGSAPNADQLEVMQVNSSTSTPCALFYTDIDAAAAITAQGGEGYVTASHGSGTVSQALALIGNAELTSTGTVTTLDGVRGTAGASGTGTITHASDLKAAGGFDTGGATITNKYGLYVANQTVGSTNYAIYTEGGHVRLGSLPTSDPGGSGRLWNDSGTVKIT